MGWIGTFEGKKGTGKEKVFESEMVKMLRLAGAVLFCKTSVPHTLMSGETTNNIIGYTLNPKNRNLTSGGSSGGEGALIGIKGCMALFCFLLFVKSFGFVIGDLADDDISTAWSWDGYRRIDTHSCCMYVLGSKT